MRATHWSARIYMLFIIIFPGGITWLSPSNRVAQQCQASLPLPSLLGYFTSSNIQHAEY